MLSKKDKKNNSPILEITAEMKGSLAFNDPVHLKINGQFNGSLDTKGILDVGSSAEVHANIIGEEVILSGKIKGNIHASKSLHLMSSCHLIGNIETPSLKIDFGAVLEGRVHMQEDVHAPLPDKSMISHDELRNYLNVSEKELTKWLEAKGVTENLVGRQKMYNKEEIDRWIEDSRVSV